MAADKADQTGNTDPAGDVPAGEVAIMTVAMPADANPMGDIFGGWLLSQMDIAGGLIANQRAGGRTATVAVEAMQFHRPVFVGDTLCCYGEIIHTGTTSVGVRVEAWVIRIDAVDRILVTEGVFTYVAIDDDRRPRPLPTG